MSYNIKNFKEVSIFMLSSILDGIELNPNNDPRINNIKKNIEEAMNLIKSLEFKKDCTGWVTATWDGCEQLARPHIFEYSIEKFKETLFKKLSCIGKFNNASLYIEGYLNLLIEQYKNIF